MAIDQKQLQRRLRRVSWIVGALALLYLYVRFDNMSLPVNGCSPLVRFAPGDSLLLDKRPAGYAPGDAVLFVVEEGGARQLHLGKVERVEPEGAGRAQVERLWLVTDAANCPGLASPELGWVERDRCRARVIFAWPW